MTPVAPPALPSGGGESPSAPAARGPSPPTPPPVASLSRGDAAPPLFADIDFDEIASQWGEGMGGGPDEFADEDVFVPSPPRSPVRPTSPAHSPAALPPAPSRGDGDV
eukprot:gene23282-11324_t